MLTNFNDLTREEFIQYITLCFTYFYNIYDKFTEPELNYFNDFVQKLNEVYDL